MRLLGAALLLAAAGCAATPPATAPLPARPSGILVVTIDTLRADRVGVYGSQVETPNMDRLAREGAWAPKADVHVPLTRPSHVSLFTGRYPAEHGVRDNVSPPLAPDVPLLAESFQRAGWPTAAFVASTVLDRQSGLARGFDVYNDRFEGGADRRPGDRVVADAVAWMKGKPAFLAWVHLYEPHAPYSPPEPYASRYAGRPYDGTVAWADTLVGRLLTALAKDGMLDRTLVIVTSDHGEALGDHGEDVHGYFVYESTLRVPFVLRGPGVRPGTTLTGVVRTVDVCPTILELAGLSGTAPTSGRSLAAALAGARMTDEATFAESLVPLLHYGWSDLRAVRDGRWKYVLAPKPELYDLDADPGELKNLASADAARATALRAALESRLNTERPETRRPSAAAGVPPDLLERLGALGYVGPGGPVPPRVNRAKAEDPKDRLEDYKALSAAMQDALIAVRASKYSDAVARLRDVEQRGVDSYDVHYWLGRAHAGQRHWRQAAAEYDAAAKRLPGGSEAWRGLGESRVALGDRGGAIAAFQQLVALAPGDAVGRMELGEALRDAGRYQEAAGVIREALAIDPGPAQYWQSLGTVLGAAGDFAGAERAFAEAISRDPTNGQYVYNHGVALFRLGRRDEAAAQMNRAAALGYRPPRL